MLARMRTALKFLTYGILIGIFFAPRSGAETRQQVKDWGNETARGLIENAKGMASESMSSEGTQG